MTESTTAPWRTESMDANDNFILIKLGGASGAPPRPPARSARMNRAPLAARGSWLVIVEIGRASCRERGWCAWRKFSGEGGGTNSVAGFVVAGRVGLRDVRMWAVAAY